MSSTGRTYRRRQLYLHGTRACECTSPGIRAGRSTGGLYDAAECFRTPRVDGCSNESNDHCCRIWQPPRPDGELVTRRRPTDGVARVACGTLAGSLGRVASTVADTHVRPWRCSPLRPWPCRRSGRCLPLRTATSYLSDIVIISRQSKAPWPSTGSAAYNRPALVDENGGRLTLHGARFWPRMLSWPTSD